MLTPEGRKLDEILIRLLAHRPNLTAQQLHRSAAAIRPCTLQGVYHELRKLQADGVVLKVRGAYTLSLPWAFEFMNLADCIYDNYIATPSQSEILPAENSSKSWKFTNLLRLDDFWVQTMVVVFRHTKSKDLYNWIPHPWYYFAQMSKVKQFYSLFESEGWKYHSTIGGTTFLDRRYAEAMPKSFFEYRLGETPVFSDMSKYCTLIGDFMMTVKLDATTAARIDDLFASITSVKAMKLDEIIKLLNTPCRLTFKLEYNSRKVGAYVRKFERFFGQ